MTDKEIIKEIIKALGEMVDYPHNYEEGQQLNDALDLINRQKAEIERLETKKSKVHRVIPKMIEAAKAEAIKEFAERVKKYFNPDSSYEIRQYIDNIVKEMLSVKCENQGENLRKNVKVIGEQ